MKKLKTLKEKLINAGIITGTTITQMPMKVYSSGLLKTLTEKIIKAGIITGIAITQIPMNVYAGGLQNTKLYTGTIKLLGDLTPLLLGIEAVLAAVLVIMEGMKYQAADDQEKSKHMKNIKTIMGIGIFIMAATGLIPVIFGYYK